MMKEQILIQNCGDDYDKGSQEKSSFKSLFLEHVTEIIIPVNLPMIPMILFYE